MSSPGAAPTLPPELQMEVLSWLPVKTLMKCKCVSKSWKSLITDNPKFANVHLKKSPKKLYIILTFEDDIETDYNDRDICFISCSVNRLLEGPSSMIDEDKCYRLKGDHLVIGSYNGLVCLGNIGTIEEFWIRLWNPTTRLSSEKSPTFQMNLRTHEFGSWGKMNCGFGYDHSCDTYKVVVVLQDRTERKMEIRVHCIGGNCWRKISNDPDFPLLLKQVNGQFAGGCVNWLALDKVNGPTYQWGSVNLQQLVIVSFNMHNEVYSYISLPEGVNEVPYVEPDLGVLGNNMCFFHDHKRTHFVVWQLRVYGIRESWSQLVSVSYEHLQCEGFLFRPMPMYLSEDGDFLLLAHTEEVVKYNLRDNSVEYIELPNKGKTNWLSVDGYVQSLVSPYRG